MRFSFRGKPPAPYPAAIPDILAGVLANTSLQELDIENSRAGVMLVEKLREIIEVHPTIVVVRFDGSDIDDLRGLVELFELPRSRERPIRIEYAARDIAALRAGAKISDADVLRVHNHWRDSVRPYSPLCAPLFLNSAGKGIGTCVSDIPVDWLQPSEAESAGGEEIDRLNAEFVSDVKWQDELEGLPDVDLDQFAAFALARFDFQTLLKGLH
jgi:hypothetical protein